MKRKRGHKKGKQKKPPVPVPVVAANDAYLNVVSLNTEDNSGLDDFDNAESDSGMEGDTPSSTGTDQPDKLASINPDGSVARTPGQLVYGRVKVKLKTSKVLESQHHTSSDAPTQSDTDKSSPPMCLEKPGVTEKMEDSANSSPQMKIDVSGNPVKKAASIKIKSSRGVGSSSISQISNAVLVQGDRPQQKELKITHQDPRPNKEELSAALEVIKKVMKMDAAEPFNVPVNPIALGIPDYFDVIDTPMDFGTISRNLENGLKYMNSEDVFKDVQYIWQNCYKYNNKGDYIIDLMKRVKKNLAKYWSAAGLYSEQQRMNGAESIQAEDVAFSSQGKVHAKGGHMKQKTGKRHGVKRHKDGCLCAICVLKRRRKEREENAQIVEDKIGTGDGDLALELKQQETSPVESPCGEDTSSNMDNSLDPDSDADLEEKGEEVKSETNEQQYSPQQEKREEMEKANEIDIQKKGEGETPEQSQLGDGSGEEPTRQSQTQIVQESGAGILADTQKEDMLVQHEEEAAAVQQRTLEESQEKHQKTRMLDNLHIENPMLLELCGVLFPDKPRSVWSGPHSLVWQQSSARNSSIHAAIETFMK